MYFDQAFFEKVILLAITALITGFDIPYVLKRIEERKLREQKKFEANLVRQNKIIEAQSKLLDDLAGLLWNWRYLAKKVVYYGAQENMERYDSAKKQYEEESGAYSMSSGQRLVDQEGWYQRKLIRGWILYTNTLYMTLM